MDHDAQIARFVSDLNRRLRGRDEAASRLEVVLKRCGWVKKSSHNLDQIQEALETAGIFPAPRLTMRVNRSERIRFRRQAGPGRMLFAREEDLRDFLYENFRTSERLTILSGHRGRSDSGQGVASTFCAVLGPTTPTSSSS